MLSRTAETCLDAGATPVLVHHATKSGAKLANSADEPLDLDDLAFAGIGEFARQWLLLNRRTPFQPGSGKHALFLNAGGSAGHSSCWEIDVDEGTVTQEFDSRGWKVKVRPANLESEVR